MTTDVIIPLIARGRVITDDLVTFTARRGEVTFRTPDVKMHLTSLILRNPSELSDLYEITLAEIVDYLAELGQRLDPASNQHVQQAVELSIAVSGLSPAILRQMYDAMRGMFDRQRVQEVIETNIGAEYLEGWVPRRLLDRLTHVRAFGARTVHINAGNGPAVAPFSVLMNAVLRSDGIVKSPSNDPMTATAIALTMIEMAPDHPLTKHLTVAYWKGGDTELESRLYRPVNIEKIVAWGGSASMSSIRGILGPGIDLIALDPKSSASIIGPDALESEKSMQTVAGLLARDVGQFNQEGCANARVAYVVSPDGPAAIERVNRFGQMVYDALQALPPEFSGPHPAFDPALREEIDGIRGTDWYRVIGGRGAEGAVIVSQEDDTVDFADRLGCRVVNIVPVHDAAEAVKQVTVHTQSIGIYPESLKHEVRDECARRGAQRLTSLGFACSIGLAQPHDAIEQMRRMARWLVVETFDDTAVPGAGLAFG